MCVRLKKYNETYGPFGHTLYGGKSDSDDNYDYHYVSLRAVVYGRCLRKAIEHEGAQINTDASNCITVVFPPYLPEIELIQELISEPSALKFIRASLAFDRDHGA